jgi:hypothetical protein
MYQIISPIALKKGCSGWGANPGSFDFRLFSHHSTTEPQWLPTLQFKTLTYIYALQSLPNTKSLSNFLIFFQMSHSSKLKNKDIYIYL